MAAPHIDPASFHHNFIDTCGYKYHYVQEGNPQGEPLMLIHGFPDIWYGWRHQIKFLANLGYRVLAVDCLGYGQTSNPVCDPSALQPYSMKSVCTQLVGILDALNIPKVTVIGHDWGGALVWRLGLHFPDRIKGIISVCTAYGPPVSKYRSLEDIVKLVPEFEYQLNFAKPSTTAKMDAKPDAILGNVLGMGNMSEEDIAYYVEQYRHSGFHGPLNYYKTTKVNFDNEVGLGKMIHLPACIIVAERDMFLKPYLAQKSKDYIPALKMFNIDAGHFVLTEKPDEVNQLLKKCLESMPWQQPKASL